MAEIDNELQSQINANENIMSQLLNSVIATMIRMLSPMFEATVADANVDDSKAQALSTLQEFAMLENENEKLNHSLDDMVK